MIETLFINSVVTRLGWVLVHFLWQGAVAGLVCAILLLFMRRPKANICYITIYSLFVLTACLPVLTYIYISSPASSIPHETSEAGAISNVAAPQSSGQSPASTSERPDSTQIESTKPPLTLTQIIDPLRNTMAACLEPYLFQYVLLWFIGVLLLSARRLMGWYGLRKLKIENVKPFVDGLKERFQKIQEKLSIQKPVSFLESAAAKVPMTVGWMKPAVLIPASVLTGLHPNHLEAIIVHELAHIKRNDYLLNLIQTIIETLYFYHPIVWWMSHRIRVEREKCCDEISADVCGGVYEYIEALAKLEDLRRSQYQLAMTANRGSLYKRVEHLLRFPASHSSRSSLSALISLSSLIILLSYIGVHGILAFARVEEKPIGIFTHTAMIGSPTVSGEVQYDESRDVYAVTGSGKGACKWEDEIIFAYKKMTGSWSIEATLEWTGSEIPRKANLGLMCRESTNAGSKQVFLFLPGNMNWINMHHRLHTGHSQYTSGSLVSMNLHEQPIRFRLTRLHLENRFLLEWYDPQTKHWNVFSSLPLAMPHTVLLGITASSGADEPLTRVNGYFRDLQIKKNPFHWT